VWLWLAAFALSVAEAFCAVAELGAINRVRKAPRAGLFWRRLWVAGWWMLALVTVTTVGGMLMYTVDRDLAVPEIVGAVTGGCLYLIWYKRRLFAVWHRIEPRLPQWMHLKPTRRRVEAKA
jgi:hypothetical protein